MLKIIFTYLTSASADDDGEILSLDAENDADRSRKAGLVLAIWPDYSLAIYFRPKRLSLWKRLRR